MVVGAEALLEVLAEENEEDERASCGSAAARECRSVTSFLLGLLLVLGRGECLLIFEGVWEWAECVEDRRERRAVCLEMRFWVLRLWVLRRWVGGILCVVREFEGEDLREDIDVEEAVVER